MRRWALVVGVTATLTTAALAGTLLKEDFEGARDGWHLTSGGGVSVDDDGGGLGSGRALFLTMDAGSTQRRLVASFPPVELSKAGDEIALRFDFRITGSDAAKRGSGDALWGFRFGLFDSMGTLQTADATEKSSSGEATDDVGYIAMLSVGIRNRASLVDEKAEDVHFMGGSDLHYLRSDEAFGGINDQAKHTALLTIRRVSGSAIRLELLVDGKKTLSADVIDSLRTRFDEVAFAGSNNACNFAIDNVEVTSTAPADGQQTRVRGRCEPCKIEVGQTTMLTADAQGPSGSTLTYKWTAPTGKFGDATARRTPWRAPVRGGWTEERWQKEGDVPIAIAVAVEDGRGWAASDTVAVQVTRPPVQ